MLILFTWSFCLTSELALALVFSLRRIAASRSRLSRCCCSSAAAAAAAAAVAAAIRWSRSSWNTPFEESAANYRQFLKDIVTDKQKKNNNKKIKKIENQAKQNKTKTKRKWIARKFYSTFYALFVNWFLKLNTKIK